MCLNIAAACMFPDGSTLPVLPGSRRPTVQRHTRSPPPASDKESTLAADTTIGPCSVRTVPDDENGQHNQNKTYHDDCDTCVVAIATIGNAFRVRCGVWGGARWDRWFMSMVGFHPRVWFLSTNNTLYYYINATPCCTSAF